MNPVAVMPQVRILPMDIESAATNISQQVFEPQDQLSIRAEQALHELNEMLDALPATGASLVQAAGVYDAIESLKLVREDLKRSLDVTKTDPHAKYVKLVEEVRAHVSSLASVSSQLSIVKKWIEAGYDRSVLETDPEGVKYVGAGDLIFSIKMYKDAKHQLQETDMDLKIEDGKIRVKVEGAWQPTSEVADRIVFDKVGKKYTGWSYTHPNGFVRGDIMDWNTLIPAAKLSPEALIALQEKAKGFWRTHDEIDPGIEKKYTIQVVTTAGDRFLPDTPLLQNVESMLPRHVRIRLIDDEGQVYSFSTKMPEEDANFVLGLIRLGDDTGFSLRTADTKVVSPDYEETRKFLYSNAASIPISKDRFQVIKGTVESVNSQGGVRFCFSKQNCCRFCQGVLKLAGVDVETKIDGLTFLYRILPDAKDIPYIGQAVAAVAKIVSAVFHAVVSCVPKILRKPLDQCMGVIHDVLTFVPRMIGTLCLNILFRSVFGANQGRKSKIHAPVETDAERLLHLSRFDQVMSSPFDLFKTDSSSVYHAKLMTDWIKKQGSYQAFTEKSSGFCVVEA